MKYSIIIEPKENGYYGQIKDEEGFSIYTSPVLFNPREIINNLNFLASQLLTEENINMLTYVPVNAKAGDFLTEEKENLASKFTQLVIDFPVTTTLVPRQNLVKKCCGRG